MTDPKLSDLLLGWCGNETFSSSEWEEVTSAYWPLDAIRQRLLTLLPAPVLRWLRRPDHSRILQRVWLQLYPPPDVERGPDAFQPPGRNQRLVRRRCLLILPQLAGLRHHYTFGRQQDGDDFAGVHQPRRSASQRHHYYDARPVICLERGCTGVPDWRCWLLGLGQPAAHAG